MGRPARRAGGRAAGSCTNEVDAFLGPNGTYQLDLPPGTWWVQGVVYVYGTSTTQTVTSAPRQVTIAVGAKVKENFTVPVG